MPVRIEDLEDSAPIPAKPGTNGHALLRVLLEHPDLGFTPRELAELTDVPSGSVSKTLARLEEREQVERHDGYWTVADRTHANFVGTILSLEAIEDRYGDDYYGRTEGWAEDLPDLGEDV